MSDDKTITSDSAATGTITGETTDTDRSEEAHV